MSYTLRDRLAETAGVWEGSYTVLGPQGGLLDRFASRQETRLEGNDWYERIVYHHLERGKEVLDFHSTVDPATNNRLVFEREDFEGEAYLVGRDILVFPYRWRNRPQETIIETIYWITPTVRTRLWQHIVGDGVDRLTLIQEKKLVGESPEMWH